MKIRILFLFLIIFLVGSLTNVSAQVDSVIGQVTNSLANQSFAGGISGDGRFVVFESTGNLATQNARNADGNREIFLFDYAQRRIFQITDTKVLLNDTTLTNIPSNTRVDIDNNRPVISNDGRWIAFSSNATTSTPAAPNNTNPGNFDANSFTDADGNNVLTKDGNMEMWLFQIPTVPAADLRTGAELPLTDLSGGSFIRVTNTLPSRLPIAGSATVAPFIADDNHDASINDDGNTISFGSTRDLVPSVGNAAPNNNDEIFTYTRSANTLSQVTQTPRGTASRPIYATNSTISGNGRRVTLFSNADNPIVGMTGGMNSDNNFEVFYSDLAADGSPAAAKIQVTNTTQTNPGDIVNILSFGRRMSRGGRYIAFDSFADLANENGGANQSSFALYLYDTTNGTFRRIGPRSTEDTIAAGGDVPHYPGFTDYDANGEAQTLVFESRQNFTSDGTAVSSNDSGLNPTAERPIQIYSFPLGQPAASATLKRLTKLPPVDQRVGGLLNSTRPILSNSSSRIALSLALTEVGTGNPDLGSEVFYLLVPTVTSEVTQALNYSTGASRLKVSQSPVPTPTASPSPTPQTPDAVQGVAPGTLTFINYDLNPNPTVTPRTAAGSLDRRFTLPIELSGVTVSVNGAAAGIKSVGNGEILFVVPPALATATTNDTTYPVVININGAVIRDTLTIVPARPDIFLLSGVAAPNGRARIFNATNRVLTREPFTVTTIKRKGGRRVPTTLRLYLTGVEVLRGLTSLAATATVRVGDVTVPISGATATDPGQNNIVLREPGVYTVDFILPDSLDKAGDVPIIFSITIGGVTYQSRLDDTAPRFRIL